MRWVRSLAAALVVALAGSAVACTGGSTPVARTADSADSADTWCTRDVLRFAVGSYFLALTVRHDPDWLPFAPDLKATENGAPTTPGQGLWETATGTRLLRSAFDTDTCSTHSQALLTEDGTDVMVGVRLKLADYRITEVETYVTRQGDYFLFSPDGLLSSDQARPDVAWEAPVPEGQRATREELVALADQYFSMFGSSVDRAPFQSGCDRWENGQRMTSGNCTTGVPTGEGDGQSNFITNRRYVVADVEAGVAVGYVMFGSALDFHMFKVVDGRVLLIQAVVTGSGHTSTGW
jgi:hypothetical protein